jgi:hypothetical protein
VTYSPTEERSDQIVNELNVAERQLVKQFAKTLDRYGCLSTSED